MNQIYLYTDDFQLIDRVLGYSLNLKLKEGMDLELVRKRSDDHLMTVCSYDLTVIDEKVPVPELIQILEKNQILNLGSPFVLRILKQPFLQPKSIHKCIKEVQLAELDTHLSTSLSIKNPTT